jgi:alkylhydroperoxidase family enzyme
MSYIEQVDVDSASGPIKQVYEAAIRRAGGVANIIRVMSLDARVCQASMSLYVNAVRSDRVLDRATREMLATVVSSVNDCYY